MFFQVITLHVHKNQTFLRVGQSKRLVMEKIDVTCACLYKLINNVIKIIVSIYLL